MEASKTRAPPPLSAKQKAALALAITWVAGFVDAVGYLVLSHIYTSNTERQHGKRGPAHRSALPPICLLLVLAVVDIFRPIAMTCAKHVE